MTKHDFHSSNLAKCKSINGFSIVLLLQCITLFYKDEQCRQIMRQLLVEVVLYHFHLFEHTLDAEFSKISDIIESFYSCCAQISKKMPQAFNEDAIDCTKLVHFGKKTLTQTNRNKKFKKKIECDFFCSFIAMKAMTLPEVGAIKHSICFLVHFILQSRDLPHLRSAVLKKGEEIIHTTLLCIGVYTMRNHVDYFADIFVALNKKYPAELVAWLKLLEVPDFPTVYVSAQDKDAFAKAIVRYVIDLLMMSRMESQRHLSTI